MCLAELLLFGQLVGILPVMYLSMNSHISSPSISVRDAFLAHNRQCVCGDPLA